MDLWRGQNQSNSNKKGVLYKSPWHPWCGFDPIRACAVTEGQLSGCICETCRNDESKLCGRASLLSSTKSVGHFRSGSEPDSSSRQHRQRENSAPMHCTTGGQVLSRFHCTAVDRSKGPCETITNSICSMVLAILNLYMQPQGHSPAATFSAVSAAWLTPRDTIYFLPSARAFARTASLLLALTPIFFVPSMLYDEDEASLELGGMLPRLAWPPVDAWLGISRASALGAARAASPAQPVSYTHLTLPTTPYV